MTELKQIVVTGKFRISSLGCGEDGRQYDLLVCDNEDNVLDTYPIGMLKDGEPEYLIYEKFIESQKALIVESYY